MSSPHRAGISMPIYCGQRCTRLATQSLEAGAGVGRRTCLACPTHLTERRRWVEVGGRPTVTAVIQPDGVTPDEPDGLFDLDFGDAS